MLEDVSPASSRQAAGRPERDPLALESGTGYQAASPYQAATPRKGPSFSGAGRNTGPLPGSRSARKKKGLFRRVGIIGPAIGIAAVVVALVTAAAYMMSPAGSGAGGLGALNALTHSNSIAQLEAERANLIAMSAAASTLSSGSKPVMVNPHQVVASASAAAAASSAAAQQSSSSSSGSSSGSGSGSGSGSTTVTAPSVAPANPGSAEAVAQQLMPSYGFSVSGQYGCLYNLWMRESGWNVYAQNPSSGAYGIPQALPGDKMASAGSDWQSSASTQEKWGLGYIQSVYGTPCSAWGHEESDGWY